MENKLNKRTAWNKGMTKKTHPDKIKYGLSGKDNPNFGKKRPHSEETKRKISIANKGTLPWTTGKRHSEETKENMRKNNAHYWEGKEFSEEHKQKMRGRVPWNKGIKMWEDREHPRGTLGRKHSEEWKEQRSKSLLGNKINVGRSPWNKGKKGLQKAWNKGKKISGMSGKKHTEETKRKIIISNKGQKRSFETIKKIKERRSKQILPHKDTSIELKIQDFLTTLRIEFVTHKYMNIKNSYQCDIFIPSMNLIIEADGDFFHMNPNKFSSQDRIFKNGITAEEKWKLDSDRTKQLIEKGYNVIRIWENEIRKMELEDFKCKLKEVKNLGI